MIMRGFLLSGALLMTACISKKPVQIAPIPIPDWAVLGDRIESAEIESVYFEYSGDSTRAVQWSREVLDNMGFSECLGQAAGWHDFGGVRRGSELRTRRLVQFAFRAEPPSIATVEALEGSPSHSLMLQLRRLPTTALVHAERDLLCGQMP